MTKLLSYQIVQNVCYVSTFMHCSNGLAFDLFIAKQLLLYMLILLVLYISISYTGCSPAIIFILFI